MFPQDQRLRRKRDIALVLRRGRATRNAHLTLRWLTTKLAYPRVTVVIGKTVSKRATVRNRLKRQLRHLLRSELADIHRGVDIMLFVRPSFAKAPQLEQHATLKDVLQRSRLTT